MESVWDYPRPPRVEASARRVRVEFGGEVIADTTRAYRVLETSHPPVYYIPPDDVRLSSCARAGGTRSASGRAGVLLRPRGRRARGRATPRGTYPDPRARLRGDPRPPRLLPGRVDAASSTTSGSWRRRATSTAAGSRPRSWARSRGARHRRLVAVRPRRRAAPAAPRRTAAPPRPRSPPPTWPWYLQRYQGQATGGHTPDGRAEDRAPTYPARPTDPLVPGREEAGPVGSASQTRAVSPWCRTRRQVPLSDAPSAAARGRSPAARADQ